MNTGSLTHLGTFAVFTGVHSAPFTPTDHLTDRDRAEYVETVDAYAEPDGNVRIVETWGHDVRSTMRDAPRGGGQWTAHGNDYGIRYVSTPVTRATFLRWVREAKALAPYIVTDELTG